MEPLLYDSLTQVVVVPLSKRLKRNDLPLYRRPGGQYVMHRVIKVEGGGYRTRGDNRGRSEYVPEEWILGIATEIYRKGRHIHVEDFGYRFYLCLLELSTPLRMLKFKLRGLRNRIGGKRN